MAKNCTPTGKMPSKAPVKPVMKQIPGNRFVSAKAPVKSSPKTKKV